MNLFDLKPLRNLINEFEPEDLIHFKDKTELIEPLLQLLDEYVNSDISCFVSGNYKHRWLSFIIQQIEVIVENMDGAEYISVLDDLHDVAYHVISIYEETVPCRSFSNTFIRNQQDEAHKCMIDKKLQLIYNKNKQCADQKTLAWHMQRYNVISASVAWKAVDTESSQNSLIYSKCSPLNTEKFKYVNVNTPMHWGQKFEPISQSYYEYIYNVHIAEFGCIPHSEYSFLGASPDGIIIDRTDNRYGRVIEIKNIVNRDITGIPKKEYWVQMQMQMQCCDLNECDFLECRFKLYETEQEFTDDGSFKRTVLGQYKGIIMCFYDDGKPLYEYMPFQCTETENEQWQEQMMKKHEKLTWNKNEYWYLDEVSCVLVLRNNTWFNGVVGEYKDIWDTVVKERVTGYSHRAPKKRVAHKEKSPVTRLNTTISNVLIDTITRSQEQTVVQPSLCPDALGQDNGNDGNNGNGNNGNGNNGNDNNDKRSSKLVITIDTR